MSILLKRGNTVIKEINDYTNNTVKVQKEDHSNILNVRVNRRNTIGDNIAPISNNYKKDFNKNLKNINRDKDTGVIKNFDAASKFIPQKNQLKVEDKAIENYLKVYGLTDKDFEEPKDKVEVKIESTDTTESHKDDHATIEEKYSESTDTTESCKDDHVAIEEKYSEYIDDEYDHFEKIKKRKNIDNY